MRIKIVMILFSVLLAFVLFKFLTAPAYAILDPSQVSIGSGESLADTLIDASNGMGVATGDTRFAPTPQKSRDLWANRTGVNFTMPSTLSGGGNNPQESRAQAEATDTQQDQSANTQDVATDTTQMPEETPQTTSEPAAAAGNVSGSWMFELNDNTLKDMVLTLFQSDEGTVFGTGSMRDGNSTFPVTASGSTDGENLNLDVTTSGSINIYKLVLKASGDSASGDYKAFSADGQSWTGTATGGRSSD
jgi:hypothetical protein